MYKLSVDTPVPESHCREAAQIYWRVRYLEQTAASEAVQDLLSTYEPWIVELESDESPEEALGLSPVGQCVYATIYDAFLANYSGLTSPGLVFRGHADARWDLLPTRLRLKASETIAFYEEHKNTFIAECRRIVPDATDLHLEAVCQHYGFPTCLLDLTESFEVAAFFATLPAWSGDLLVDRYRNIGCVWIFPQELLNKGGGFVSGELMVPGLISNQRLVRQRGAFVDLPAVNQASELRALGRAVVFSRMGLAKPRFRGQGTELTRVYLFPPDEDDDIGRAARSHVDAIHRRAGFLRALDGCLAELELSESTRREQFLAALDSLQDDPPTLMNAWDRSERLWALEYYLNNNKILLARQIMSSDHFNLFGFSPWHELLCEFVLCSLGEKHQAQGYSEDDLKHLVLSSLNKGLVSSDFVVRLLEVVGNQCQVLSETLRQTIILAARDDGLIEYEIKRSLGALQALCVWYWAEPNSDIREQIEALIKDSGNLGDHLTNWPPSLPRFVYIHPAWTFSSDIMIWELDTLETTRQIAAVSSDHNLYLLDFEGRRRARLDLLGPGRSVRFISEKRLVASNMAGAALWLEIREDSDSLEIERKQCLMDGWEGESCDVNLDVAPDGSRVIAGYGSSRSDAGGIAIFDNRGELLWRTALEGRVREVSFWDSSIRCLGTGWRTDGRMYAFLIDEERQLQELCQGELVHLAGFSSTRRSVLLSVKRDMHSYRLIEYSPDRKANLLFESDRMTWRAFKSDHQGFLVSTNNALSEPPKADVELRSGDGRIMWKYEVPRQAMQLVVDEEGERVYFSGQGQGNVYVLSLNGDMLFCSRVKYAPLCFSLSKKFDTLFVGSKTIAAISIR